MRRVLIGALVISLAGAAPAGSQEEVPPSLTLQARTPTITYGFSTRLTGRLDGADSAVRVLTVRAGRERLLRRVTPGAGGTFAVTVRPRRRTTYVARHGDLRSRLTRVHVRARVTLEPLTSAGGRVSFRGTLLPAVPGVVSILRGPEPNCRDIPVARSRVARGPYAFSLVRREGRYRAVFNPDDPALSGGSSGPRFVGPAATSPMCIEG